MLITNEARKIIEEKFPEATIRLCIDHKNKFVFIMTVNGMLEIHSVDRRTGSVSGFIALDELMEDPEFQRKWQDANKKVRK